MARGNRTIVTADPKGQFEEFIVPASVTLYAGMAVTKDPSVALQGGKFTCKIYDADIDGGRPKGAVFIVTEELLALWGKHWDTGYTAGGRCSAYSPRAGEELNLLLADVAGTADDHAVGEILIIKDTTGKFIATTGSPEQEVAMLLEVVTDPVADTRVWCEWTGS